MDASKLTQIRAQAANNYKSNWKPRDASEVTMRNYQMATKNNNTEHRGPLGSCPSKTDIPIGNFTTSYTADVAFMRGAGSVCSDSNWGNPGGFYLKTAEEINTILNIPENPITQQPCYNNSNTYHRVVPSASNLSEAYTGSYNQVPTNGKGLANNYPIGPLHYKTF